MWAEPNRDLSRPINPCLACLGHRLRHRALFVTACWPAFVTGKDVMFSTCVSLTVPEGLLEGVPRRCSDLGWGLGLLTAPSLRLT